MPKSIGDLYRLQSDVDTAQSAKHYQQVRADKARRALADALAGLAAADERLETAQRALEEYTCTTT
jgi:hypothetical protein